MKELAIDLHVHTTASDGKRTPAETVRIAEERHLDCIAITDHDTVSGVAEARRAAGNRLYVVPGVEVSIAGDRELHILGYFPDLNNERLNETLEHLAAARQDRARNIVKKLQELGIAITYEEVAAQAQGTSLGRPHVAYALMERGVVHSMEEAFDRYLERGRAAYVASEKLPLPTAMELLRECGAVCVWAHPFKTASDQMTLRALLTEMKGMGLSGVECIHPSADAGRSRMLMRWCREEKLFITGGSDWHDKKNGAPLGWSAEYLTPGMLGRSAARRIPMRKRFLY